MVAGTAFGCAVVAALTLLGREQAAALVRPLAGPLTDLATLAVLGAGSLALYGVVLVATLRLARIRLGRR